MKLQKITLYSLIVLSLPKSILNPSVPGNPQDRDSFLFLVLMPDVYIIQVRSSTEVSLGHEHEHVFGNLYGIYARSVHSIAECDSRGDKSRCKN